MEDLLAVAASANELSQQSATLKAILKATKEQTASVKELPLQILQIEGLTNARTQEMGKLDELNASLKAIEKQNAAILAAMQEQTRAIEKLAAPARESGKRKRVEGTSADAGNQQETSATDSQTSVPEKLVSSSLKGTGTADAGEGISTARGKKKMKAPSPAPAPAKEVVSVNATGPHEGTCTWTIYNFSKLKVDEEGESYSDIFSIGGHQWELFVYPKGVRSGKGKSVSLGLQLADDIDQLPEGWQVTVDSTFSVICQHNSDKSHKEEGVDIFDALHKAWGWDELIPLEDFHDAANGFLANDTLIIEAEMEVKAPAKEVVSVNAIGPHEGTCRWTIPNFSKLKVDEGGWKSSDVFSIGGHEWKLGVRPRGVTLLLVQDKLVSLYLMLADDRDKLPEGWKVTADYSLSVICQNDTEKSHKKDGAITDFTRFAVKGYADFIPLTDFHDPANGFLVNDTVVIEAKMEVKAPAGIVSVNATGPHEDTCTWTIPHFSKLKLDLLSWKISDVFSIGGHEWKLRIFPRGKGSGKDKSVSFALLLADDHGKVTADFSLSMICQRDPEKSHTKENTFKEFTCRAAKGYADFIPLTDFHDPANGFLVNDTVIIKAKIEVKAPAPAPAPAPPKADVKNTKAASASAPSPAPANWMVDESVNAARRLDKWGAYTWRIPNFSKLKWIDYDRETSDTFSIGGHKWKLCVYLPTPPQGRSTRGQKSHEKNKSLSLSLVLADTDKLPKDGKVTANLCLSVTCQRDPEGSRKVETKNTFTAHFNSDHWEWNNIIPLTDLRDPKRGYLVKDTMIIEAKIDV